MENKIPDGEAQKWVIKIEHLDATDSDEEAGELCIRLPDKLMEQLEWAVGDEVEWEETEIGETWGEHKGFTLSNRTKNPKMEPIPWKYGLIKVALNDEGVQTNILVELYSLGKTGEYNMFCRASPETLEEIKRAKQDVEHDGINEFFFNNGTFEWTPEKEAYDWNWTPKKNHSAY